MLKITELRCEYKINPVGIDIKTPRVSWKLESESRGVMQTAYHIQVSKNDPGFSTIIWDTGIRNSDQSIHVEYEGEALESRTRYYYRIRVWDNKGNDSGWSETAFWEMGLLEPDEWKARWITSHEDDGVCPMLRKTFEAGKKIKKARIYATSLGLYMLYLNGSRVGDCLFTPGWTSYDKRLQYQTYDVTDMIKSSRNAIGIILGNGWYKLYLTWAREEKRQVIYGDKLAALLQLIITYEDGREDIIISDDDWKVSTGPILMSDIYNGETYDARLEKEGWSEAEYDDSGWEPASRYQYQEGRLVAQENVPVKTVQELKPIEIITTPVGEKVLDFGQNIAGWVRFQVEGPASTEVTLRHAELLDRNGNFFAGNLGNAKQTIKYIVKGAGKETYAPHFTFQGFRYVKVEGYPGELLPEAFIAQVIHSDLELTGSFTCSNELVNKLQQNIQWSQRGNFIDVPTDCPQREERFGWTGDAQVFLRTACFNMGVAPFITKWLRDLYADQTAEKGVPVVVPMVLNADKDFSSAGWGDAAVICPWILYTCYGDLRILEEHYESMKMWVEYIRNQGDNEYLWNTGHQIGDWLAYDAHGGSLVGSTPVDFIATAFYAWSTELLAKTAGILGKDDDAYKYEDLRSKILKHFRNEFVSPNGRLSSPTQTAHVLALMFNLIEEKDRQRTIDTLVKYIVKNNYHLSTGFLGTSYLCLVLSENGHNDIAYKLLLQTDCPSWLYEVKKGATTIWECWDGIKEDGSFWNISGVIPSFNHYAYGAIGDWLYRVVTGIDAGTPGYKHISIRPKPESGLTYAKASYKSLYGEIQSSWEKAGSQFKICIAIPPNTTATVVLPGAKPNTVREGYTDLLNSQGIIKFEQTDEGTLLELGSGTYEFSYNADLVYNAE